MTINWLTNTFLDQTTKWIFYEKKIILGIISAILVSGALLAFNLEKKATSGGLRLFTTSAANGCRLSLCWTLAGGVCTNPCPVGTYYTQKTANGKCKTVYTRCKTTIN